MVLAKEATSNGFKVTGNYKAHGGRRNFVEGEGNQVQHLPREMRQGQLMVNSALDTKMLGIAPTGNYLEGIK